MTGLHVQARPFPGHVPAPAPDTAKTAAGGIAAARRNLAGPAEHPAGCRCSVWCRDEWEYSSSPRGKCVACGEHCRSVDPEGRVRHPNCAARGEA